MQLKKIELQGFKSFADKTEIVFLDGITTIVGPNGSGKSNISDSLRWVLGEQSVKSLRGSKMEDVIFSGTQARKKVGFAQVSIYLDNTDSTLPVEYKEVVVTRRVYRTGESNYLINNNECRLKDIQELFMDTGVGKDGYSIISQGKIDEILSTKSEERRHIFEEASGIVKYRTRKEEATKKLANTQTTLARLNDILSEIENIIGPLEKKSETAKKYLMLKDELKIFDVRLFVNLVNDNVVNLNKLDDVINTFENDIENELKISKESEEQKVALKERIQEITLKIEETQEKYFNMQSEVEKLSSKIEIKNTEIENGNQNIKRLLDEVEEDNNRILLLEEEIEKRLQKRKSMSDNKKKFEIELEEKQEQLNKIMNTLDKKDIQIDEIKKKIDESNDEKYDLKVDISSIEATIEANEKQIEEKKKIAQKNIFLKDSLNLEKEEISQVLNEKSKELSSINNTIDLNSNIKKEYLLDFEKIEKNVSVLKEKIMVGTSKLNYLVNIEKENEGYYKSVKSALEYSKSNSRVYGTLASLISTKEEYEYAIEIALGGYIQNIVVESENEAKNIISYLKEKSLGRATFLPLTSIKDIRFDLKSKASKCEGYIAVASELVKYDKKYFKAINLSLGTTVIVDTIDNAIKMSKVLKNSVRIVTLAGELISATGSITGGQTAKSKSGLIGRSEKIANLKESISKDENEYNEIATKMNEIKMKIDSVESILEENKVKKDEINIELVKYNEKYEHITNEIEKLETTKQNSNLEVETLENEKNSLLQKIEIYNEKIEKIDEENEKNQVVVDEYRRFNKEKSQEMDFLNEDIVNLKISLSSFDETVSSIDEMKEKIEQDIGNFKFSIDRKNEQVELLKEEIKNSIKEIEELKESIKSQHNSKDEFTKIVEKLKSEKNEITVNQEKVEENIIECLKNIEKLKEEKSKVESKKVKFDLEIENIKNKMWEDYELTISGCKKMLENIEVDELDTKQISKKAENIRKQIKDLGEVNISAIEEFKTTKERYDFISNQKNDLEETKSKLNNLISNMTSIMKNQFAKQFKIITENFNETFKELFGGGKADLRLSDESNILESGIEIEVQPPGKKLQSMMLLSGGERALTATALLFAILKIKSPPFCILDEIEAALDDVNVHRFAEYIKKYSKKTQFIVITHRKGTMEVASSTYGVTMQEYGISKIVSMKLK